MAVSRKPVPSSAPVPVDVDALIRKGGSVPEDEAASFSARKTIPVTLRIPRGLLKQVDESLKTRSVPIPRHTWLLEAVHEKLARSMTDQCVNDHQKVNESEQAPRL